MTPQEMQNEFVLAIDILKEKQQQEQTSKLLQDQLDVFMQNLGIKEQRKQTSKARTELTKSGQKLLWQTIPNSLQECFANHFPRLAVLDEFYLTFDIKVGTNISTIFRTISANYIYLADSEEINEILEAILGGDHIILEISNGNIHFASATGECCFVHHDGKTFFYDKYVQPRQEFEIDSREVASFEQEMTDLFSPHCSVVIGRRDMK